MSFTKLVVTLCSARHLPHVDGIWGNCDAFVELEYKNQTKKSVVVKNKLDPDWTPAEEFVFDLSKGELVDLKVTLKDWNRITAVKVLGTTLIGVDKLKQLMAGQKASRLGDEFFITKEDGTPLVGHDEEKTFILLKLAASESGAAAASPPLEVAPATDVGGVNLFNSPVKINDADTPDKDLGHTATPVLESDNDIDPTDPKMEFIFDVNEFEPPNSTWQTTFSSTTPSLAIQLMQEPVQRAPLQEPVQRATLAIEHPQYERAPLARMRIQDRQDNFWRTESPLQESVQSSPASSFMSAPHSLHVTDTSKAEINTLQGFAGKGYVAGHRHRITLHDRGISNTAGDLYMREDRNLYASAPTEHVRTGLGKDATFFGNSAESLSTSLYSTFSRIAPRSRETIKGYNRVLQNYTYADGERLERSPSSYSMHSALYSSAGPTTTPQDFYSDSIYASTQRAAPVRQQQKSLYASDSGIYRSALPNITREFHPSATLQAAPVRQEQTGQSCLYASNSGLTGPRSLESPNLYSRVHSSPSSSTARQTGWTAYSDAEAPSASMHSPRSKSYLEFAPISSSYASAPTSRISSVTSSPYQYANTSGLASEAYSGSSTSNFDKAYAPSAPSSSYSNYSSYQSNRVSTIKEEGLVVSDSYRESIEFC